MWIEDQTLMHEAELWCSDFERLMEYRRNADYGKTKCFRCLISTDREESGIFIGINKLISRALDVDGDPVYPCQVLNRFECPYDKNISRDVVEEGITDKPDVDYLFHLSELAFAVEETLGKVLDQGLKEKHKQYKSQDNRIFCEYERQD
jgi:hypothetical protein